MNAIRNSLFGLCALAAVGAMPTHAQLAPPQRAEPAPAPSAAVIEELEVIGQRSLLSFRLQMYDAEDFMYALFNELNGNDKLDVLCELRAPTGTRIQRRTCVRRYMQQAEAAMTADALRGYTPFKSHVELWQENAAYHAEFSAQVNTLMATNPEFVTAIAETVKARERYAAERRHTLENTFLGRLLSGQPRSERVPVSEETVTPRE